MKRCMGTDKPKVSILMAVYNPQITWLSKQLISLNEQTYENLELLIMDDCSTNIKFNELYIMVNQYITGFPVKIMQNASNGGSNKVFSLLTEFAQGEYFAYCDQDDIWEKNKLSILMETIDKEGSVLAYSDMSVIDRDGKTIAASLKEIRPRLNYKSGTNLAKVYAFSNCTAGCSMIVKGSIAKKALPFLSDTTYDQWICLIASNYGKISFVSYQLIKYRQHGENQTGILTGVVDKESYKRLRITPMVNRVLKCNERMEIPQEIVAFARARHERKLLEIWKYRDLCKKDAMFELVTTFLPDMLVKKLLRIIKI